jgi:hypothetical protein
MASDRDTMALDVTSTLGGRTDLATLAGAWVNRSYMKLQDTIEFPESHTTANIAMVVATTSYTAPTDLFSIISVRNMATGQRLRQISAQGYDRLSQTITGSPHVYSLLGRTTFRVWRVPTAIETIRLTYRKTLAELTTGATVHVLPVSWEEAIIFGATAYGFEYLNETERARNARVSQRAIISQLTDRLAADLVDRDEPFAPVGIQTGVTI